MAPRLGFEPRTNGLTVHCSTAELPRNGYFFLKVPHKSNGIRLDRQTSKNADAGRLCSRVGRRDHHGISHPAVWSRHRGAPAPNTFRSS